MYIGGNKGSDVDYTLLEILVKLKTTGHKSFINYHDFCTWLGPFVEPPEGYYFRHDSKKNPQFETNMQKVIN